MARWHRADALPARLAEFRERDWPPVEGECLGNYACRDAGYGVDCVSLGGPCGYRTRAMIEAEYPEEKAAEILARFARADAYERFQQARLAWLGEDHPDYVTVMVNGWAEKREIRCGLPRGFRW